MTPSHAAKGARFCSYKCYHASTRIPISEKLATLIDTSSTGCWPWMGHLVDGYAQTWHDGKNRKVTRILWEIAHGPLARKDYMCHTCDNRACCRLSHLFLGDAQVNVEDKVAKGRQAQGDGHGRRTRPERWTRASGPKRFLTETDVEVLEALRIDGLTLVEAAKWFGVSAATAARSLSN